MRKNTINIIKAIHFYSDWIIRPGIGPNGSEVLSAQRILHPLGFLKSTHQAEFWFPGAGGALNNALNTRPESTCSGLDLVKQMALLFQGRLGVDHNAERISTDDIGYGRMPERQVYREGFILFTEMFISDIGQLLTVNLQGKELETETGGKFVACSANIITSALDKLPYCKIGMGYEEDARFVDLKSLWNCAPVLAAELAWNAEALNMQLQGILPAGNSHFDNVV